MARPKNRGKQKMPTLGTADIITVLMADGWYPVDATNHNALKHPTKKGKVIVGSWSEIRMGDWAMRNVLDTAQMSKAQFCELFWKTR